MPNFAKEKKTLIETIEDARTINGISKAFLTRLCNISYESVRNLYNPDKGGHFLTINKIRETLKIKMVISLIQPNETNQNVFVNNIKEISNYAKLSKKNINQNRQYFDLNDLNQNEILFKTIKKIMKEREILIVDMSKKTGISSNSLSGILKGSDFRIESLIRILYFLRIRLSFSFMNNDEKNYIKDSI